MAFVHLGTEERARAFFTPYRLTDVPRFSDPQGSLYQEFGLVRAEFRQYFNRETVFRLLMAWCKGNFAIIPQGDVERMPGAFLFYNSEIRKAFRHKLISDRPDYVALASASFS